VLFGAGRRRAADLGAGFSYGSLIQPFEHRAGSSCPLLHGGRDAIFLIIGEKLRRGGGLALRR
jgi:hypothetical protein